MDMHLSHLPRSKRSSLHQRAWPGGEGGGRGEDGEGGGQEHHGGEQGKRWDPMSDVRSMLDE